MSGIWLEMHFPWRVADWNVLHKSTGWKVFDVNHRCYPIELGKISDEYSIGVGERHRG